eukprot:GHVU01110653.1.p1 GENE.GHVU01110653.1~~GHVU01110653.1.p1  ORF type:complete len:188 (-),score=20.94 GHVU01110653.1:893-1456(-)
MGAEVSSCCAVEPAGDKKVVQSKDAANGKVPNGEANDKGGAAAYAATPQGGAASPPPPAPAPPAEPVPDTKAFSNKLHEAVQVTVLLANGTSLTCMLKLEGIGQDNASLSISCDSNMRSIPINELRNVLHGRDQLKRVETRANLVDDPKCVALHLSTGNCIPLRFDVLEDKEAFVALVKELKKQAAG